MNAFQASENLPVETDGFITSIKRSVNACIASRGVVLVMPPSVPLVCFIFLKICQ